MPHVLLRHDGAVARLTLNRPETLNALSEAAAREFEAAVRSLRRGPARAVLLEGAGPAFCAGGDLAFIERNRSRPRAALAPLMRRFYASFLSLRGLPQPVVAKVHGAAVGAGLCLALACDLRVVAEDARLSFNFVRLGLSPGLAAWPLARAAMGDARARELLFTGRTFSGRDLAAWGGALCVPAARLDAAAEDLAKEAAAGSPAAVRALKAETSLRGALAVFLSHEARHQAATFKGRDLGEGLAALRGRRAPRF